MLSLNFFSISKPAEAKRARESSAPVVPETINLCKSYRKSPGLFGRSRQVTALNNVSFTRGKGETPGVVGKSGSGKSSLGRVLVK
ncbi:ATP-binding cassette domain-containing protein [Tatumella sp. UBA2305]|uniref:ATP-binding cassette domain-containing protein n=1 Tax=Tatumella sp. UBA2305 TaxID=1947647 RepID=UPI0025D13647|nr:ATP-binding cassette domain-containing protein [Tatumella sp. UBA2305]